MIDADAFAVLIADWCLDVQPGQQVLVRTTTLAEELATALAGAILDRGAWPLLRLEPRDLAAEFVRHADQEHLERVAPLDLHQAERVDASVRIAAPASVHPFAAVDAATAARVLQAQGTLRAALRRHRWAVSLWPTPALAQQANMEIGAYTDFLLRALFLDRPDPVAAWRNLHVEQARLIERLEPVREIHIETAGTDLLLNVEGRTWINSDGKRNMPSGEVFTGPHESSANGTIHFDVPSNGRGVEVSGVDVTFEDGEVVHAHAHVGDRHLQAALATDAGARFLGELGIGTNSGIDRATGSTLLDEKMAGTVHLALGSSYPETGGTNESALHWDLICDLRRGGRVSIDGETLIQDGKFVA